MALQYVGGNTATKAGATSGNSNLSLTALTGGLASSASAGDIVIAVFATGSAADRTLLIQDPSANAYTLINSERYANGTSYDSNLRVAYKILTAADANTVFGPTGNNADAGAMAVHVWRGVDTGTPLDVTAVGTSGTGTGRPNALAITPTTTGAIVIVAGGAAAGAGAVFVSSDLSNFRTATSADTNDAMVGVGSFAWTSGAFDPAAWTGGTTNAADSWTAITLALRPSVDQTLTPSLYTNDQTFYAPTVASTYELTPSLYTNDQTFYSPDVTQTAPAQDLTPDLYTNAQTFYSPDVTQSGGAVTLTPDLYTNAQTFYAATVSASYALSPDLYTDAQTFYSPTVTAGFLLQPALYTNAQTFFDPTVSQAAGNVTLTPDLYTNAQSFYAPTVTPGAVTLAPQDYVDNGYVDPGYIGPNTGSTAAFYSPIVGPPGLLPGLLQNTSTFYTASVFNLYPDPADVRLGVVYGPGGTLVGTFKGGGQVWLRRR